MHATTRLWPWRCATTLDDLPRSVDKTRSVEPDVCHAIEIISVVTAHDVVL
jgi:hypothetical protein